MAEVASAFVTLVPSFRGGSAAISRELGGSLDTAGRQGGSRLGGGILSSAKSFVAPLVGLFALNAAKDFFGSAIAGASDLNEASTKITAIFGTASGAVNKFADQGAKALGQTKLEVLNAAASFGTFGKAAGLQGPALSTFSTTLSSLSTDLASFYNTDPSQAAEAIAAGLRGESEPLRQFGVLLDDATLRQEALRQGLVKTTKTALTPQQRVLAAQAVIMRQTADAQGDFARTSGGLANQQRILSAQFEGVKTTIGTALLPIAVKFVTFLNNDLGPAFGKVINFVKPFTDALQGAFKLLVSGDFTGEIRKLLGAEEDAPIIGTILNIRDAITGLFDFIVKGDFTGAFRRAFNLEEDSKTVETLFNIRNAAMQIGPAFAAFGAAALPVLQQVGSFIVDQLVPAFMQYYQAVIGLVAVVLPIIQQFAAGLIARLAPLMPQVQAIFSAIGSIIVLTMQTISAVISTVTAIISFVWRNWGAQILGVVTAVFAAVIGVVGPALRLVAAIIRAVLAVIRGDWSGAWSALKDIVRSAFAVINGVISGSVGIIKALLAGAWAVIVSGARAAWAAFTGAVSAGISAAVGRARALPGQLVSAFGDLGGLLVGAGQRLIQGLIDGILSKVGAVTGAISSVAQTIKDHLPGSPIKTGPLKSWNNGGAGKRLGGLLVDGLTASTSDVSKAMTALVTPPKFADVGRLSVNRQQAVSGSAAAGGTSVTFNGNVGWQPDEVASRIAVKQRDAFTARSLRVAVG